MSILFELPFTYVVFYSFVNVFHIIVIRVSSVELSVVFSVEKMSVEKNMRLNSTIYNTGVYPGLHR